MPRIRCVPFTVALLAATAAPAGAVDPGDLLKYAPGHANAVVVISPQRILASPRAAKDGWAKIDHTEILAGAVPVNPHLEYVVVVKDFHPRSPAGGPAFALASARQPLDLDQLVKLSGGQRCSICDEPLVMTPNKSFLAPFEPQLFGIAWTDNRQEVGRWLRAAKVSRASPLAPYLNGVVRTLGPLHHVVVGLDTDELFDREHAGVVVALSKALAVDQAGAEKVQQFLAGLRGVSLTVDFTTDGMAAALRFDSTAQLVKVNPELFKQFVLETLSRNGAMTEDLPVAAAAAGEGFVTLKFKLSDPELAQIMALFLPPLPNVSSDAVPVAPAGVTPAATVKYIRTVNRVVDDLKQQTKRARDYERTALWYDAAANRIETLSVLNVDKSAIEFALGTAGRLRAIGDSLRGVPIQLNQLDSQVYSFTSYRGGLYWAGRGRVGISASPYTQTNVVSIWQQEAQAVEQDRQNRAALWSAVDSLRPRIRSEMADKYKIDVEAPPK